MTEHIKKEAFRAGFKQGLNEGFNQLAVFNIPLCTIQKIELILHWSLTLYLFPIVLQGKWETLLGAVAVIFFISAHEYGHALTAKKLGVAVDNIYLFPIGGMANIAMPDEDANKEFLVSFAGPLVSVFLLLVFACANTIYPHAYLQFGVTINFYIIMFNMLPIFPMDGGRVVRSLMAEKIGFEKANKISNYLADIGCATIGVCGVIYNDIRLIIVIGIVYLLNKAERAMIERRKSSQS